MPGNIELQAQTKQILENLQGLEPLKELFWSKLNYERANQPLSRRGWTDTARNALAEEPTLLATGAKDGDFKVVYCRLAGGLLRGRERPVISRLLRDYPYSLFVFSNDNQDHWHFVNVKYDDDVERRRLFRRITVGKDERLRTASERVALLDLESVGPDLFGLSSLAIQNRHDEAFDVEQVTKEFFARYQVVFRDLWQNLERQTRDKSWAHDYALQFLNRCMFLYFVQRKRWLGDDTEFLRAFWEAYGSTGQPKDTFFSRWLKTLFFEAFNNGFHGGHRQFPDKIRDALALAPFLNGGLFRENELDRMPGFNIADEWSKRVFKFLENYNFTIAEDSPLDQEVAVDPEMIGKVYESLVNVSEEADERGDAGIFYTPRTEIDLMCRLALVDNLANHLGGEHKNLFYRLVFALDPEEKTAADQAVAAAGLWPKTAARLRELTVLDPACGSGSFLVGMLRILDDLLERGDRQLGQHESGYERKKRIIGQSLYGVDVMDWACHVAELRLWLALIIDAQFTREELHVRREPLLPHFSFKIRCGDSLVQEVGGVDLGHIRGLLSVPRELKARVTQLKNEKLKFYNNDPACRFKTPEQASQEELHVFRDILDARAHRIQEDIKAVRRNIEITARQLRLDGTAEPRPPRQRRLEEVEWERQIEALTDEQELTEQTRAALRSAKDMPFVWDIAFVEVFAGEQNGFDIVAGNPPYVRQENISDPFLPRGKVTAEKKRLYKDKLARSVYEMFPRFFGYRPQENKLGHKLDAKSDLYIYFYFHGLSLLNPKGSFCFITSNSWLDVGYGKDLQEFLLKHSHVKFVLDNQVKRSFASVDVNTVIVLLSAPDDRREWALDQTARFVMLKTPFEHVLSPVVFEELEEASERKTTKEYRVVPVTQQRLLEAGCELPEEGKVSGPLIKVARYIGDKWGGKYLRAPDIYWTILEKGKGKLVRLGDIAEVRRGFTTGANEFFYLDEERVRDWGIEREFLSPVLRRPRECERILLNPREFQYEVFLCDKTKKDLKGTAALKYILHGEKQGYDQLPTCASRALWYDLGTPKPTQIAAKMTTKYRHYFPVSRTSILVDHRFYEVRPHSASVPSLAASLNAPFVPMWLECTGRAYGGGGGPLDIMVYELKQAMTVDPTLLDAASDFWSEEILRRPVLHIWKEAELSDRRAFDEPFFDILKLTKGERDAVYEALVGMVKQRLEKARSFAPARTRAGAEAEQNGD